MEIYKKLHKVKKKIGAISKDTKNPFFKSSYFDINKLLSEVEPILEKEGLLILQPITDGKVYTKIFDIETGESVESVIDLPNIQDPQKLGSAITYYRRYTLQSLLSLQAEDDDANTSSKYVKSNNVDNNLPWLNDADLQKIIASAKAKGLKANDLRKHYKINKVNFSKLENGLK